MGTKPKKKPVVKKKKIDVVVDTMNYDGDYAEMDSDIDLDAIAELIEDIDDLPIYLNVLIYGEQGTGKTTIAGTFPGPVCFIDCNEEGTLSVRGLGHKRFKVRKFETLEGIYWYLRTRKHPFKTVVLDTTTQLADIGMEKVLEEDDHRGLPIRKHWGQNTSLMKTWLIRFRNLDMHTVFIAQLRRLDEDDLDDDESHTKVPMMSPAVRASLGAGVDIIGYTFIKEVEREVKGKTTVGYSYRMRIGPSSDILTKVRVPKGTKYPAVIENPSFEKLFNIVAKED